MQVHAGSLSLALLAALLVARVAEGCPLGFDPDEHEPQRVVVQYIDRVLHMWREYEIGTDASQSTCIFQEEPVRRLLDAEEASRLLASSRSWKHSRGPTTAAEILDADDPRLALDPMETPRFGTPFPAAAAQVGNDNLIRIPSARAGVYPWNTIAFIVVTFPNGEMWRGTGFLAGPHVVLTNAHMVFGEQRGGFANDVTIAPAQTQHEEGGEVERPFGTRNAHSVWKPVEYNSMQDFDTDYAAIFVCDPFDIATYMPLSFDERPARITTAGFPSQVQEESRSFAMWQGTGDVTEIQDRFLFYDVECSSGASGSPVWSFNAAEDTRRVVAVHAFEVVTPDLHYRGGPRLVSENRSTFQDWLARQPGDPGLEGCTPPTATPTSTPKDTPFVPTSTPPITEVPATPPVPSSCAGDCNGDGLVRINELVIAVNDALSLTLFCKPADADSDGKVRVSELVTAVKACLNGCPE